MKVLVVTDVLWRNDNGVGNSYSNIFSGMRDVEIANICCQEGKSQNSISQQCFQISESRLLKNLTNSSISTGVVEQKSQNAREIFSDDKGNSIIRKIKRSRMQIFFWIRNFIWKLGRWRSEELNNFIDGYNPDIIFAQLQDKIYLNDLIRYVQEYSMCPLVLYAWDDVYSLKQFSVSPFYWIDRFMQRCSIRKVVAKSKLLYTISAEQKEEYGKNFKCETALLYKGYEFGTISQIEEVHNKVLTILYTGNLYSGRYETLLQICQKLEKYNKNILKAQLYIYSGTDLSDRQIDKINIKNSSFFKGKISEQEVQKLQKEADILLHIEPLSLKGSCLCRLSFSTKLVDYFYNTKCIFAVGSSRCSAIKYLKRNDAAIVAENLEEAGQKLIDLLESKKMIREYAVKAWECGYRNHQIKHIQREVEKNLMKLIQEKKEL